MIVNGTEKIRVLQYDSRCLIIKILIDFYIRHRSGVAKVVGAINDLWKTYGIDDLKIQSTYISLFMKNLDLQATDFELEIIEEYLRSNPTDRHNVRWRLAFIYENNHDYEMALKHLHQMLDVVKEKERVLARILRIHIKAKLYDRTIKLLAEYGEAYATLNSLLQKALAEGDQERLLVVGEIFYRSGNIQEFSSALTASPLDIKVKLYVINTLSKEHGIEVDADADDDIPF